MSAADVAVLAAGDGVALVPHAATAMAMTASETMPRDLIECMDLLLLADPMFRILGG
jgi:hypothetical protein